MGIPGPAIPEHNSYCVHFLGSDDSFAKAAEALLKPFKVPVRYFDSVAADTEDGFLKNAFWETTLAVVHADSAENLEILGYVKREDGRFEFPGDSLQKKFVIAYSNFEVSKKDLIRTPDLWLVQFTGSVLESTTEQAVLEAIAETWIAQGAAAVAVFNPHGAACWISDSAVFGKSQGFYAPFYAPHSPPSLSATSSADPSSEGSTAIKSTKISPNSLSFFCAGLVQALIEELLGENLFLKTSVSVDRECLEVRPLHLARAAESGLAAHRVFTGVFTEVFTENPGMTLLHKKGEALGKVRRQLLAWRGPEPKAWGNRGR